MAAAYAGAKIFLVPPGNCSYAELADVTKEQISLVKSRSMPAPRSGSVQADVDGVSWEKPGP